MKFAREQFTRELCEEMKPLWQRHNAEIPQLGLEVDPDLITYTKLDISKHLRTFTARDGGKLVGYQIFFLGRHPHRRLSVEATQDVLYLAPESRKGLVGVKFITWCDNQLVKESVSVIHHPISYASDFGAILKRMGYTPEDITYSRKVRAA